MESERCAAGVEIRKPSPGGISVLAEGLGLLERVLPDDRRQVVAFRFPGDMLCLDGAGDRQRFVAVTPAIVCGLPKAAVAELIVEHAELQQALLLAACHELAQLGDRLLVLGRLSAPERIATFLLEMLVRSGGQPDDTGAITVRLPMSREDIADYLGLNVETVSRTLSRFKRDGLIRLPKPGRAVIDDLAPLQALSPLSMETFRPDA